MRIQTKSPKFVKPICLLGLRKLLQSCAPVPTTGATLKSLDVLKNDGEFLSKVAADLLFLPKTSTISTVLQSFADDWSTTGATCAEWRKTAVFSQTTGAGPVRPCSALVSSM